MSQPFQPEKAVRFELGRGRVSVGSSDAQLLVPVEALAELCSSAGEEGARHFGRRLGAEIGRRAAERLSKTASPAELVEHLGGDFALSGLGSLSIEAWGRALVFKVEGSPLGAKGDAVLSAVLEGALQQAVGRETTVMPLSRTDSPARLLVSSAKAAAAVKSWLSTGTQWGDALARLNATGAP